MILRFFKGGLTYSDLTDRPEAGELFEGAYAFMVGWQEAEKIVQDRNEAKARAR